MTQHRSLLATTSLVLLLGCTAAPLSSGPITEPIGAAGLPSAAPQAGRDLVSTLPTLPAAATDLFIDAHDRLHAVSSTAVMRLAPDGRTTVVLGPDLSPDVPREQRERELHHPYFGAMGPHGTFYAIGMLNRLYAVAPDGRTLASHVLSDAVTTSFSGADVAIDSQGRVYFTVSVPNDGTDRPTRGWIGRLEADGTVSAFAGDPNGPAGYQDGPGAGAQFDGPAALAIDAFDNVYVADRGNLSIRRITPEGVVTTVMGKGKPQLPRSPMPGQPSPDLAPFYDGTVNVVTLAVSRAGDLFYVTPDNRIWRVTPEGESSLLAGTGRVCQGPVACTGMGECPQPPPDACFIDGPGLQAEFNGIRSLVATRNGTLYALDGWTSGNPNRVRRIEWAGAPAPSVVQPGPRAVRTTRSAPPAATPSPSPQPVVTLPSCRPEAGCAEITGRVYDETGRLASGDLEVLAAIPGQPASTIRLGTIVSGAYRVTHPQVRGPLELIIRGEAFGTRRRPLTSDRRYASQVASPSVTELNFGGRPTSGDPDAAVFFMPGRGRELGYATPSPLMPFEPTTVTTVAGDGRDDTFFNLSGLDVRPNGDVLVASPSKNAIITVTPTGTVSLLAGGPYDSPADQARHQLDGQGGAARFHGPADVALDAQGVAYVADKSNSAIRKVAPDGTVTTLAGTRGGGYVDAEGAAARFRTPDGVAVDRHGTVFVADTGNHCIRAITASGKVSTYAGANTPGWANGLRLQARFRSPAKLAFGPDGSLYVADNGNHRIRRITPDGLVSDAYGAPASAPDGTAQMPAIDHPHQVVVDSRGDLFTAHSERVYRIQPSGAMTILTGYGRSGYADGSAESAYFSGIRGLGIDRMGRIYVAESGNMRIRMIAYR